MIDVVRCVKCGQDTYVTMINCPHCGASMRHSRSNVVENIILTTSYWIIGREIEREIEIITSECVFGVNIFRDWVARQRDQVGGRSKGMQNVLRDARRTCLLELRREALAIEADAVIGVDLDYSEISGGGKSMLFLVASGTAVRLMPPVRASAESEPSDWNRGVGNV